MTTTIYSKKNNLFPFYKKSLKQSAPFAIITAVLFMVVVLLSNYVSSINEAVKKGIKHGIYENIEHEVAFIFLLTCIAGIFAFVINSYMHTKQKVDFYHALPLTRTQIYTSNMLVFLTVICVPFLMMAMGTGVIYRLFFSYCTVEGMMLITVLTTLKIVMHLLCVYLFVSFISVNVGTIFENVMLAGIIGFIPLIVLTIIIGLMSSLIYGYHSQFTQVFWLSPYTAFMGDINNYYGDFDASQNLITAVYLFALCVVFYILGIAFYNKRKSELAESKSGNNWPQILSKVFISFATATLFAYIFAEGEIEYGISFVPVIILTIIIGLVAEIILSRGIKSLKKNAKLIFIGIVLFLAVYFVLNLDLFGFEKYIPKAKEVKSVTINTNTLIRQSEYDSGYKGDYTVTLEDPQDIEAILEVHSLMIESIPEAKENDGRGRRDSRPYRPLTVEYILSNGNTVNRLYRNSNDQQVAPIQQLEANADYIEKRAPIFFFAGNNKTVKNAQFIGLDKLIQEPIPYEDVDALLEVLRADMLDESLENIRKPKKVYGYVVLGYNEKNLAKEMGIETNRWYGESSVEEYSLPITNEYTRTMKFLEGKGIFTNQAKEKIPTEVAVYFYEDYVFTNIGIKVVRASSSGEITAINQNFSPIYSYSTEDSQAMELITSRSSVQIYNSPEMNKENRLYVVKVYYDNGTSTYRYLDLKDLPANIQEEILAGDKEILLEYQEIDKDY